MPDFRLRGSERPPTSAASHFSLATLLLATRPCSVTSLLATLPLAWTLVMQLSLHHFQATPTALSLTVNWHFSRLAPDSSSFFVRALDPIRLLSKLFQSHRLSF